MSCNSGLQTDSSENIHLYIQVLIITDVHPNASHLLILHSQFYQLASLLYYGSQQCHCHQKWKKCTHVRTVLVFALYFRKKMSPVLL